MTDSNRTSASTGFPTPVDVGTPAGHPTPAGEPTSPDLDPPQPDASAPILSGASDAGTHDSATSAQPDLFPGARPCALPPANRELLRLIGGLVVACGSLEQSMAEKLAAMRRSFGDVRAVGGRPRPTVQKLLAELRALVAMRDRHDKQALTVIAEIDGTLQRTAQFRQLIVEGAYDAAGSALLCRDLKNSPFSIPAAEIAREIAQIDRIRSQIAAL